MIWGFLRLLRLHNLAIAGLSLITSFILARKFPNTVVFLSSILAVFLIGGAGYVLNDYADVETDKKCHPQRPIPQGIVSPKVAFTLGILFGIAGIGVSFFLPREAAVVCILTLLSIVGYDFWLKNLPFWGNFAVALSASLVFLLGGLVVGRVERLFFPFVFAFLFHLGREIIKSVEDVEGDKMAGRKTLPVAYGKNKALRLTRCIFCVLVLLTPLPYFLGHYGLPYLLVVTLGVDLPLLWLVLRLGDFTEKPDLKKVSVFLKVEMLVALMALLWGGIR